MEANRHPFFGLAAERETAIDFRKSRLMLASNFLVGTFFSASRFSFASNGELLKLKAHLDGWFRYWSAKTFERFEQFPNENMVCTAYAFKPPLAAVRTFVGQGVVFLNRNEETGHAARTLELKSGDVLGLNNYSLFSGHITSEV